MAVRIATLFSMVLAAGVGCSGSDVDQVPPSCTGAVYDRCVTEHDCANELCYKFDDLGFVCSQTCAASDDTMCALANGLTGTCEGGFCKPAEVTECVMPHSDAGVGL